MDDLISREDAIDVLGEKPLAWEQGEYEEGLQTQWESDVESIKALPSAQQWIPCSERLPEDDRTKVVTLANGSTECGYYSNGDWWCIGDTITLENPTVIAWMPLPEPYEVK